VLVTKSALSVTGRPLDLRAAAPELRAGVEANLRSLEVERMDVVNSDSWWARP